MLSQKIFSLIIVCCAFGTSTSVLDEDDYDLMYENFDNEIEGVIPPAEETPSCDCQQEHTEWDKLFIMLENSQMKENMLLQSVDEILKVEMQTLKVEMMQFVANFAGMSTTAIEKISSQLVLHVDEMLLKNHRQVQESKNLQASEQGEFLEELLTLNHNVSKRLSQLESVWQQRTEAEAQAFPLQDKSTYTREDNLILNSLWQELQETRTELKQSQKWAAQHLLPAGCETAILFPMRSKKIFGSVHPTVAMTLHSFTICVWVKVTEMLNKTIVFSYGTKKNPYEIQLYLSHEAAVLAVGSDQDKLITQNTVSAGQWVHLCGTWSSEKGTTSLWLHGDLVASTSDIATSHIIPDGGILQIGQEKNGCCVGGGFDETLAFSGKLTGFNIWDRVLSDEEIKQTTGEDSCNIRGNVVGWGVTEVLPHGGAQYI
ncbi:PREDICTED: pentraxin-related protein PTX3 [Gavialis gangeticus]|uniref:pentraxin-related protein PTX3 n=1 Tax=Gavialis gangeticus TaxID=94835 RepID=UPI00092EB571|nr:PREDICTED: pentraxin-related protein PTX3 [Gavialis gangeticus]